MMGSVLVLSPNDLSISQRFAHEGSVVRVYNPPMALNGGNPKRVSSLKLLDQYDFALAMDGSDPGDVSRVMEECKVIGSGSFHWLLREVKYFTMVVNQLMNARVAEEPLIGYIDLDINTWFDGNDFVYTGYFINHMRMAEGNRGPEVPSGTGWVLWKASPADQIINSFVGVKKLLIDLNFIGPLTISYKVGEKDLYVCEIKACWLMQHVLWHELIPRGLYAMCSSLEKDKEPVHVLDCYSLGVHCMYVGSEEPKYNVDEGAAKHFYDGIATARAQTIYECKRRAYRTLKFVCDYDPEVFYRTDIGNKVEETIGTLKQWGWLHA